MNYLFGFPVGIYKINPNNYDKEKIVSDIIDNYKIDANRNNWNKSVTYTMNLMIGIMIILKK